MKKIIFLFFIHFFIIFINSLYGFLRQLSSNNDNVEEKRVIPVLDPLNRFFHTSTLRPYLIFSGIETGYGFYGKNVATNKFIVVEVYNKDSSLIRVIDYARIFKTSNGLSRFETLPSKLYNFITETDDLKKSGNRGDSLMLSKLISLREQYVEKSLKYVSRSVVDKELSKRVNISDELISEIAFFKVKLMTIIPPGNIFNYKTRDQFTHLLKEYTYTNI